MFLTHRKCTINNNFYYFKIIIVPKKLVHMETGQTIFATSGSQNFRPRRSLRTSKPRLEFHRRSCIGKAEVVEQTSLGEVVTVTPRSSHCADSYSPTSFRWVGPFPIELIFILRHFLYVTLEDFEILSLSHTHTHSLVCKEWLKVKLHLGTV